MEQKCSNLGNQGRPFFSSQAREKGIEVRYEDENLWLTQKMMAELFQVKPQNITIHLQAIYQEGELSEGATCKEFLQVQKEGQREISRQLKHYQMETGPLNVQQVKSRLQH